MLSCGIHCKSCFFQSGFWSFRRFPQSERKNMFTNLRLAIRSFVQCYPRLFSVICFSPKKTNCYIVVFFVGYVGQKNMFFFEHIWFQVKLDMFFLLQGLELYNLKEIMTQPPIVLVRCFSVVYPLCNKNSSGPAKKTANIANAMNVQIQEILQFEVPTGSPVFMISSR